MAELNTPQPISHFLRVPQIHVSISYRIRSEPLINYNDSQILTSSEHVSKLQQISEKKTIVDEKRIARQRETELTKARRAREKVLAVEAKTKRIAENEAQKLTKQKWTKSAIRKAGERMQTLVKSGCPPIDNRPGLCLQALGIAKQNRNIAKARLEAKKNKKKHDIPFRREELPPLLEHRSFYIGRNGNGVAVPNHSLFPKSTSSGFHPWSWNAGMGSFGSGQGQRGVNFVVEGNGRGHSKAWGVLDSTVAWGMNGLGISSKRRAGQDKVGSSTIGWDAGWSTGMRDFGQPSWWL